MDGVCVAVCEAVFDGEAVCEAVTDSVPVCEAVWLSLGEPVSLDEAV